MQSLPDLAPLTVRETYPTRLGLSPLLAVLSSISKMCLVLGSPSDSVNKGMVA